MQIVLKAILLIVLLDIPPRTFNIHGPFLLLKSFFTMEGSSNYKNIIRIKKKSSLGKPEWFFYCIATKTPFWKLYF